MKTILNATPNVLEIINRTVHDNLDAYVYTCDMTTDLVVNYKHEEGEDVTISFFPVEDDMMHVRYHLNNVTFGTDEYITDMGFIAKVGDTFSDYFKVVSMDNDVDWKRVRKWLSQKAVKSNATNIEYIQFLYLMSRVAVEHFRGCLTASTLKNGDVSLTPMFGFKRMVKERESALTPEIMERIRYEGWDVIRMTDVEYAKARELMHGVPYPHINTLALNRMCVRITNHTGTILLYYELDTDTNVLTATMRDEPLARDPIEFKIELNEETDTEDGELRLATRLLYCNTEHFDEWASTPIHEGCHDTNIQGIVAIFFDANCFLLHFGKASMSVKEIECKPSSGKKRAYVPSDRTTARLYKCYTLKKNWETKVERKKAEFRCLAWGVRGHFRHYKSGKVVFIAPFVKGKEKDKYKGKDYVLFPKEGKNEEGA